MIWQSDLNLFCLVFYYGFLLVFDLTRYILLLQSYDKQGFHSGTPPPFTGALHGNQSTGLAPSGTSYGAQMFIPTMAPHQQHHSTPLIHQPLHQVSNVC